MLVDFAIICASFLAAYLLFVDGRGTPLQRAIFLSALPVLLAVRYVLFVLFGIYRRVWRFASARDLVAIAAAVILSVPITVAIVARTQTLQDFPLEIFLVDALLCMTLVAGSRLALRLLPAPRGRAARRADARAHRRRRTLRPGARARARGDARSPRRRLPRRQPERAPASRARRQGARRPRRGGCSHRGHPAGRGAGDDPGRRRRSGSTPSQAASGRQASRAGSSGGRPSRAPSRSPRCPPSDGERSAPPPAPARARDASAASRGLRRPRDALRLAGLATADADALQRRDRVHADLALDRRDRSRRAAGRRGRSGSLALRVPRRACVVDRPSRDRVRGREAARRAADDGGDLPGLRARPPRRHAALRALRGRRDRGGAGALVLAVPGRRAARLSRLDARALPDRPRRHRADALVGRARRAGVSRRRARPLAARGAPAGARRSSSSRRAWRGERLRRWRSTWSAGDWLGAAVLAVGVAVVLSADARPPLEHLVRLDRLLQGPDARVRALGGRRPRDRDRRPAADRRARRARPAPRGGARRRPGHVRRPHARGDRLRSASTPRSRPPTSRRRWRSSSRSET